MTNKYEIHVTVKHDNSDDQFNQRFADFCHNINVKPIILDLDDTSGKHVDTDCMTSSTYNSTDEEIIQLSSSLANQLQMAGFDVIRVKVETTPDHPLVSRLLFEDESKGHHLEHHFQLTIKPSEINELSSICKQLELHLSRNIKKQFSINDINYWVIMATYRKYKMSISQFDNKVTNILDTLKTFGIDVSKSNTEFCLFDTQNSHDNKWLIA